MKKSKTPKGWKAEDWQKHNKWLDSFRGETISTYDKDGNKKIKGKMN